MISSIKKETIKDRYERQSKDRSNYLSRAQRYAQLTVPYVCPEGGSNEPKGMSASDTSELGWQSLGAKLVNNLSNKMDITLFPPQRSFHRAEFSNKAKKELSDAGVDDKDLAPALSKIENAGLSELGNILPRIQSVLSFKHNIITGNALLYAPNNKPYTVFGLQSYTVKRDFGGNLLEVILCQKNAFGTLPPDVQRAVRYSKRFKLDIKEDAEVELYTQAILRDGKFEVSQEAEGQLVSPRYRVKEDDLPFLVLVWNLNPGENYGRGHVEDYASDLFVYSFLSEARAKGMVLMADVKYLVKPNSYTNIDHLAESPTGEFVAGNIEDIGVLQLQKYADFTPISNVLDEIRQSLSEVFLMNRGARRNAERVTAYELRMDAQDLETSLGGVYSHYAQTYQMPIAQECTRRAIKYLGRSRGVNFSASNLQPTIITGIEALGRMNELDKIQQYGEILTSTRQWPDPMQQMVKWNKFSERVASQLSLDATSWIMSEEEVQQMRAEQAQAEQQAQAMEAMQRGIPQLAKGAMDGGQQ